MFDHIRISVFTGKNTPNFSHLTDTGNVWQGWQQYLLIGVCPLKVQFKPQLRELKISGSIPYLCRGHNYPVDSTDLHDAIDYISQLIGINVYSGWVDVLEFGQFVNVPIRVDVLLANHTHLKGFKTHGYFNQTSKYFESKALRVKLYDASQNFRQKVKGDATKVLKEAFLSTSGKHCLKVENHYKKPELYFKQHVLVSDLFYPDFVQLCKKDLLETYRRIHKTPAAVIPTHKKDLHASMLSLLVLKDLEVKYGFSVEDLLTQKLKSISNDVLTSEDKKARKRQLNKMLGQVTSETVNSPFDVSELLEEVLSEC